MNRHNAKRAILGACVAGTMLVSPVSALAEEKNDAPPPGETEWPSSAAKRLTLRSGASVLAGSVGDSTVTRGSLSTGATYDVLPRFTIHAGLGLDATRLAYDGQMDDGLGVTVSLLSPAGMSASTGFALRLLRQKPFGLDTHAAFETSIVGTAPSLTDVRVKTAQGTFNVTPYASAQTETDFRWNRLALGTTFRLALGDVTPTLGLSFERIDASMGLRLTEDSRVTVMRLGYDPQKIEGRHRMTFFLVPISTGVEFALSNDVRLGARGMIAPVGGMFWGGVAVLDVAIF